MALRARVEERRRAGEYPPGLEQELDAHFQRIVSLRGGRSTFRERLDAVDETTDAFAADAIPLRSRVPGGSFLHRIVAKVVRRQTEGVIAQVQATRAATPRRSTRWTRWSVAASSRRGLVRSSTRCRRSSPTSSGP